MGRGEGVPVGRWQGEPGEVKHRAGWSILHSLQAWLVGSCNRQDGKRKMVGQRLNCSPSFSRYSWDCDLKVFQINAFTSFKFVKFTCMKWLHYTTVLEMCWAAFKIQIFTDCFVLPHMYILNFEVTLKLHSKKDFKNVFLSYSTRVLDINYMQVNVYGQYVLQMTTISSIAN